MQILLTIHTTGIYSRPLIHLNLETKGPRGIVQKLVSMHVHIQYRLECDAELHLSTVFCAPPN